MNLNHLSPDKAELIFKGWEDKIEKIFVDKDYCYQAALTILAPVENQNKNSE
jgi:hypothetical protein